MVCVNADAPVGVKALPRIGDKYAPAPANAAEVNTSFKSPPLANVMPALSAAAPTIPAVAELAPNHVPIAGIHAGAKIAIAGMIMGATFLTNFLNPRHRSLKNPYSGSPVTGFIVPDPPRLSNSCASSGVMCASTVSPPRPCCCNCCAKAITDILIILVGLWEQLGH